MCNKPIPLDEYREHIKQENTSEDVGEEREVGETKSKDQEESDILVLQSG